MRDLSLKDIPSVISCYLSQLDVDHIDFETAFLNGTIDEEIYVEQPEGYEVKGKEEKVLRLKKALHGLKQAPRQWNTALADYLLQLGYKRCYSDHAIFVLRKGSLVSILTVYVDNLLVIGNDKNFIAKVKELNGQKFKVKDLGPVNYIIVLEVERDCTKKTTKIHQQKYINDTLSKFLPESALPVSIPFYSYARLTPEVTDQEESPHDQASPYIELVGSLIYA